VLTDVFDATDRKLSEVMVPRTEVDFLVATTPLTQAAHHVLSRPHSRYPVIQQTADAVIGFVHVRDLLTALLTDGAKNDNSDPSTRPRTVGDIARPVTLLPGSVALLPALSQLRAGDGHLAVIADEYGGTDGVVTLEDLIEELVGEIQDEYDSAVPARSAAGNVSELDGLMNRDEVQERTGIVLPRADSALSSASSKQNWDAFQHGRYPRRTRAPLHRCRNGRPSSRAH
jgi:putative hemolysin